jgi:hypothetical protein
MSKLKARFFARGFEQIEGIDFDETFAPVVNWTTVRFLLMMSILLGLETKQVDYVTAFVQADIGTTVFVEMPRGFAQPGKVPKLKNSLYGLKQSPRNHFTNKLRTLGFESYDADPCLFASNSCICLFYVDDTLLFARSQVGIEAVVQGLKNLGMNLEEEDDVAGFLGVLVRRHPGTNPTIELLQTGLIQRIVDTLQISHLPSKRTRTTWRVGFRARGRSAKFRFNYASVLGMANSRPDISLAVSQCALFASSPRRSHEQALERIGQYLKSTSSKGPLLHPPNFTGTFSTDVYADFAGGWGYEDPNDPVSVKSRTGFIFEIMGCPIQWTSANQHCNIHNGSGVYGFEYCSSCGNTSPGCDQVCFSIVTTSSLLTFKTTVHEHNQGALRLANTEPGRQTPRSKFYPIMYHWFRSWLKPKQIEVTYVESNLQKADMLTKFLSVDVFERNRRLSCGW